MGHTFLTLEAKNENAPLGIESSGHLILPQYFLFDDAIVVPLKIAEILDKTDRTLSEIVSEIPTYPTKKEEIKCSDDIKFDVVDLLKSNLTAQYRDTNTLDGIRIDLDDGWALIRASNTSPILRLTVEADNKDALEDISEKFLRITLDVIEKVKQD